ncbi:MAG: guanylate kinase [Chloroflexi bacterium]|nr:guanylate kinase [Chloroflexota bacterium]
MSMSGVRRGLVFVMSGPSGAGKTVVAKRLIPLEPNVHFCTTTTTRPPRPGERDGVDYFFVSEQDFLRRKEQGGFLETARVPPDGGWLMGVARDQVDAALARGRDVFAVLDVQGARSIRALLPQAILIFLKPPDVETLRRRLVGRATEPAADLERRLANALVELSREAEFDYSVVNADDRLEDTVEQVQAIMRRERGRPDPRFAVLDPPRGW